MSTDPKDWEGFDEALEGWRMNEKEKDVQIERLKMWHEYALSLDDKLEQALRQIEEKDTKIERLGNLLVRAADALERLDRRVHNELIAELRKAAE